MSVDNARKAIAEATSVVADIGLTEESGLTMAQVAVAEATLALAEQQRIANLIAYASHRIDHPNAVEARVEPLRALLGWTDFEIRESLGMYRNQLEREGDLKYLVHNTVHKRKAD